MIVGTFVHCWIKPAILKINVTQMLWRQHSNLSVKETIVNNSHNSAVTTRYSSYLQRLCDVVKPEPGCASSPGSTITKKRRLAIHVCAVDRQLQHEAWQLIVSDVKLDTRYLTAFRHIPPTTLLYVTLRRSFIDVRQSAASPWAPALYALSSPVQSACRPLARWLLPT